MIVWRKTGCESVDNNSATWPVSQNAMSKPPAPAKRETTFNPVGVCGDGFFGVLDFELGGLVAMMNRVNDGGLDGGVSPAAPATVADTILALFRNGCGAKAGSRAELFAKTCHVHFSAGGAIEHVGKADPGAGLGLINFLYGCHLGCLILASTVG